MPRGNLQARDHAAVWHPCSQMHDYEAFPPLEVVRASGPVIELVDGRRLYDAISSWWCKSLGHGHPALRGALREQAERFEHVIAANTTSEALVSLCERLLDTANTATFRHSTSADPLDTASHFTKVFFADNGSTGVEVALKMALQAQAQRGQTRRTKLAALANGYHGETAAAMSVSDLDLYASPHGPVMFPVTKLAPVPFRTGPDDPRWMDASEEWEKIEAQLNAESDTLAAVVYEPVLQAAGDMRPYSPDLLRRLRRWADDHGVYLVADEIAAGFGRCGTVLASHLACSGECTSCAADTEDALPNRCVGPLPDFAVLSKGLTAGWGPMSVVLTTEPVYELFYGPYFDGQAFMHSNTYAGHALGVAVAHAALDVYADTDILGQVAQHGPRLRDGLRGLQQNRGDLFDLRGVGMTAAITIKHPDGTPLDPKRRTGYRVYQAAVASRAADGCGALLRPLDDTMYLFPPLNCTPDDITAMVTVLEDALSTVLD